MKIRYQLWLIFTLLFVIMGLGMYQFIVNVYEERVLTGQAALFEAQGMNAVEKIRGTYPKFPERTQGYLEYYSDQFNARLLVMNKDKQLLFDSYNRIPMDSILNFAVLTQYKDAPTSQFIETGSYGYVQYTLLPLSEDRSMNTANLEEEYLLLIKDVNVVYEDIQDFELKILKLILMFIAIFFIICFFIAAWFTKPISGIIHQMRQITPQKRRFHMKYKRKDEILDLIVAIEEMVGQLNLYEKRQRQFLSASSHELKTPLATMQLITENIEHLKQDTEIYDEYMKDLSMQISKMKKMVDQLLDVNRMWDKPLVKTNLNTIEIEKHLKNKFQLMADHKKISLLFDTDALTLMVDRDLFLTAMDNLMSNAIRYSSEGKCVEVKFKVKGEDLIVCEICDQGIGIAEDELPYIFDPFYRSKDAGEWNEEGTGIGLVIVKQMIDRHGAGIEVRTNDAKGTCFILSFGNNNDTKQ